MMETMASADENWRVRAKYSAVVHVQMKKPPKDPNSDLPLVKRGPNLPCNRENIREREECMGESNMARPSCPTRKREGEGERECV